MPTELSPGVLHAISVIERIGSVFSLLGCLFIIVTFLASSLFHKPINRLVFYASFGNMLANVGTLIARAYVHDINSFGCQFQGFLIQQFLPADALWTLAMAFNVYLTFYCKFDAQGLKRMEVWYLLLCYGLPLTPSLAFVFISKEPQGRIYGNAVLWCWVSSGWDILRIATFYGPVWVIILATFFIYIRAGREIYRKRRQLRNLKVSSSSAHDPEALNTDEFHSMKTTEISVTTESAHPTGDAINLASLGNSKSNTAAETQGTAAYSVTISADHQPQLVPNHLDSSTSRARAKAKRKNNFEASNAAWSYTKCAILFFTALLVTWIPSSANRLYSVINGGESSAFLEIFSAIVLPLQGFWNAIIYTVTSWAAVKMFFSDLFHPKKNAISPPQHLKRPNDRNNFSFILGSRPRKNGDSDSMTELAGNTTAMSDEDLKERTI
ncbi:family A G protein-coupled receptor-like protein [Xylariaceae sp. FL1651]|nr:family A G protein-coupled receptor-like protein [Xylariaceae sp. FL1651]